MSRIHEALKKAAQERSRNAGTELEAALHEVVGNVGRSGAAGVVERDDAPTAGRDGVSYRPAARYEEGLRNCSHPTWTPDLRMNVFSGPVPDTSSAERFRTLRSRLNQIAASRVLKRILVTSTVPAEGKTFVTLNLANSISRQADRRVLLIDADLRAPRLHTGLGAPSTPGLTDYLRGEVDELKVIQHGQEGNLCLIPCGGECSNPSELLSNQRLVKLFEWGSGLFAWVLSDSPPTLPVQDASTPAGHCDGVMVVVRGGKTHHEMIDKAVSEYRQKNLL